MTFKRFQALMAEDGYCVERNGRVYEWWDAEDHSIIGQCKTIMECFYEISDHQICKEHRQMMKEILPNAEPMALP